MKLTVTFTSSGNELKSIGQMTVKNFLVNTLKLHADGESIVAFTQYLICPNKSNENEELLENKKDY